MSFVVEVTTDFLQGIEDQKIIPTNISAYDKMLPRQHEITSGTAMLDCSVHRLESQEERRLSVETVPEYLGCPCRDPLGW